jgi:uncharacterized protein YcfJ
MKKDWIMYFILMTMLVGCATWNKLDNTEKGAIIGGTSGAVVGNAVGGRGAGGTLLGGAVGAVGGGLIGREMDRNDRRRRRY